ncbi:hypothetical protein [Sphingomonas sp.]|uniref:hypothetical protein n=1 Tax=Sphingomonas sp. TaxID=28214 RepID=UPI001B280E8A|nr:hypothetical protein [Sphingomonas sp.]MBO9714060.1 hypothetical protein [Sphingomonas sp.]
MIRTVLMLATLLAAVPAQAQPGDRAQKVEKAQKIQSPEAFRDDMVARAHAILPEAILTPKSDDPLAVGFRRESGDADGEGLMNFHRIYAYCLNASDEDCDGAKREFLSKITRKLPEARAEDLRLMVRDQQYLDYVKTLEAQAKTDKGPLAYYEPLGGGLYAFLAIDSPDAIAVAGAGALEKLKMTREVAWALALRQTRAILPDLPKGGELAKAAAAYQDQEYLASLLIDLAAWEKIAIAAGPDLFVTAVSDQFVFVGLLPDGPNLDDFAKTVRDDCKAQQRCISPHIFRFRDGHWVAVR